MDYDTIGKAGSRMGTGTMIILDDKTCPVGFVKNLMEFFASESCGFCTPCRDGLPWSAQVLDDIEQGRGRTEDMHTLARQVDVYRRHRQHPLRARARRDGAIAKCDEVFLLKTLSATSRAGCP